MDEMLQNNEDKNQNGIPDWMEDREDDAEFTPQGNAFDNAYTSEESIAKNISDYKDYKWYHSPSENYFYSKGERLENAIESGEITAEELPEDSAIQKEAEQLTDDNPNNDEVNNEAIKEISQKDFDEMSIDDLEKADEAAMKGEGDYITVAQDLGFDNEDDFLYYFEQEGYKPEDVNNLTEEQKEEIRKEPNKESKFAKLKGFLSSFGGKVNTDLDVEDNFIESKEDNPITSGVHTAGYSFLGGSGSASPASIGKTNVDNESNNNSNGNHSSNSDLPAVAEMDGNIASTNGSNKVEHIDDTLDSLSFKDTEHEKDIKTNEQADLPDAEFHSEKKERFELPDIKKMMQEQGGGIHLPFKFTVENGELYVSQIGTGRKLPFDDFIKVEPSAAKQIIETMNGDE